MCTYNSAFGLCVLSASVSIGAVASSTFAQCELEELIFSGTPSGGDVAINGDRIFVGAPMSDTDPADDLIPGGVYVFRRDGGTWVEEAMLIAVGSEYLGTYLAADGDRMVASGRDAAYVFRRDENGWVEEAMLVPSDGATGKRFAGSISIDGDLIAAGAHYDDTACPGDPECRSGSAYVFRREGTAWVEDAKVVASDANRRDYFGWSIAVVGDLLFVGAPGYGPALEGALYVYSRDDNGTPKDPADDLWVKGPKITVSSDDYYVEAFAISVSAEADRLVAGATSAFCGAGDAFVFRREGAEWIEEAHLFASDYSGDSDAFGYSVSLAGDIALIGAWRHGNFDCLWSGGYGAAYVFKRLGGEWIGAPGIMEPDPVWLDRFGYFVAVSGEYAVVGSPHNQPTTFVFDVEGTTDCNGNAILDHGDISSGTSDDSNGDCVPDECQPGVCCNTLTGTCLNNVNDWACVGPDLVWTANTMCLVAGCTAAEGACCNTLVGYCEDGLMFEQCAGEPLEWHRDQLCTDIDCRPSFVAVPAVSRWGCLLTALLTLIVFKLNFKRRQFCSLVQP